MDVLRRVRRRRAVACAARPRPLLDRLESQSLATQAVDADAWWSGAAAIPPRPRRPAADARDRRAGRRPAANCWRSACARPAGARNARRTGSTCSACSTTTALRRNRRCCRARWMRARIAVAAARGAAARHATGVAPVARAGAARRWRAAVAAARNRSRGRIRCTRSGCGGRSRDGGGAHAALRTALDDAFPAATESDDGTRMLRVRTDALPAQPAGDPAK